MKTETEKLNDWLSKQLENLSKKELDEINNFHVEGVDSFFKNMQESVSAAQKSFNLIGSNPALKNKVKSILHPVTQAAQEDYMTTAEKAALESEEKAIQMAAIRELVVMMKKMDSKPVLKSPSDRLSN